MRQIIHRVSLRSLVLFSGISLASGIATSGASDRTAPMHASAYELSQVGAGEGTPGIDLVLDIVTCDTNICVNYGESSWICTDAAEGAVEGSGTYEGKQGLCTPKYFYNTTHCAGTYTTGDCGRVKPVYTDP